jgi:arsenite methyltransferase
MPKDTRNREDLRESVRTGYTQIARNGGGCCGSGDPTQFAETIGYDPQELEALPDGANLGLSCGNPTALAGLKAGQTVLDLGSGAGFDAFIAATKVGPTGRVIGVDMTAEMIAKARKSIPVFTRKTSLDNVEFRLGEIEHLPVADNSIDVAVSNCVINLSPEKDQVWREIARVLKPGGIACVSDLALKAPLPGGVKAAAEALIGCISGAVPIPETLRMIEDAGLNAMPAEDKPYHVDVMDDCNDSLYKAVRDQLPPGKKLGDYVVSVNFVARKMEI